MSGPADALLGVLARDRPQGLEACLRGIERAGAPARVVVHLDAPEDEVRAVASASGHEVLISETQIGIGASLNRILALRSPSQHFCRVDGDTEVETPDWLAMLEADLAEWATVTTVLREWKGTWSRGVFPEPGRTIKVKMGRGIGSVMLSHADACERLGAFREGIPYALEDTDWYDRLRKARLPAGLNLGVVAYEAVKPSRKLWRGTSQPDPAFLAARDSFIAENRPIHRPLPVPA